jgi:hypothetical protein
MKRTTLAFVLILALAFSAVIVTRFAKLATAQTYSIITIKPDGGIEGTDKIQRVGSVYSFTGDIFVSIIVERETI